MEFTFSQAFVQKFIQFWGEYNEEVKKNRNMW